MASSELGTIHRDAEADFPSEALDWSNGVFTCACVCGGTIDVSLGNYRRKTTIHYCLTFLNWSHPAESQVSIASASKDKQDSTQPRPAHSAANGSFSFTLTNLLKNYLGPKFPSLIWSQIPKLPWLSSSCSSNSPLLCIH